MGAGASTGLPAAAPIDAEAVAAEVAACLRDDLPDDAAKPETGVRAETRTVLQHLQYFKEHREKMDKLFAAVSPEGDVLRHKAFDAALAPRMRQQKPGGGVVETLGDVYAGAEAAIGGESSARGRQGRKFEVADGRRLPARRHAEIGRRQV